MPPGIGYEFSPVGDEDRTNVGTPGQPSASPIQDAIRVLRLNIPRIAGARSIAPQALLTGPGSAGLGPMPGLMGGGRDRGDDGGGMGGSPQFDIEALLRRLFGPMLGGAPGEMGAPGMAGLSAGAAPSPHIGIGVQAPNIPRGSVPEPQSPVGVSQQPTPGPRRPVPPRPDFGGPRLP